MAQSVTAEYMQNYLPSNLAAEFAALRNLFNEVITINIEAGTITRALGYDHIVNDLQCYLLRCERKANPDELYEVVERLHEKCKKLADSADPAQRGLGEAGLRFSRGMMCFLEPNMDIFSPELLFGIFKERNFSTLLTDILAEAGNIVSADQVLAHSNRGIAQSLFIRLDMGDYKVAAWHADRAIIQCREAIEKKESPVFAARMLEVYSIVKYFLDLRVRGKLFGVEPESTARRA